MCLPPATLITPSALTVSGWHPLQDAGVTAPVAGWPVGGMPWQETQVRPVAVQRGVAFAPETPLKLKSPWQYVAAQPVVVETQVGVAPRAVASVPKTTFWAGGVVA